MGDGRRRGSSGSTRRCSTTSSTPSAGASSAHCRTTPSTPCSTATTGCSWRRPPAARPKPRPSRCSAGWPPRSGARCSVLYLAPLRALLNNLEPRLDRYGELRRAAGRTVARRHVSVGPDPDDRRPARPAAHHPRVARGDADLPAGQRAVAVPQPPDRGHRRGPRLRRRRPRLAPAGRARTADPPGRPGPATHRAVGHRRQPRRTARLAVRVQPAAHAGSSTHRPTRSPNPR